MHQGTTPRLRATNTRTARSPTAKARILPACGPIVTGASNPSPASPHLSQIRQTSFEESRSTGIFSFLTSQARSGAPARSTTKAPAEYPAHADTAAIHRGAPAATPAGIAPRKYRKPNPNATAAPEAMFNISFQSWLKTGSVGAELPIVNGAESRTGRKHSTVRAGPRPRML